MNKKARLTAVFLMLALALCLLPIQALALGGEGEEPALEAALDGDETAPDQAVAEPDAEEAELAAAEEILAEAMAPVHIGPEDELYSVEGSIIFNNGGTVYNNGSTVYNNAGLVYNNAGTVYNNAGTVYANGGLVYNNNGQVYNNGAVLFDNSSLDAVTSAAPVLPGYDRVSFPEDYSAFVDIEGLNLSDGDNTFLPKEAVCVILPKDGYSIVAAETTSGLIEPGENGEYILSGLEEDADVTLTFKTGAPIFSILPGTYREGMYLELTAPEGAALYFTDDGSEPQVGQGRYTGPIAIPKGAAIKVIAAAEGAEPSDVIEAEYAVVDIEGPVFEPVQPRYDPETKPIVVTNDGPVDAQVLSVALSGENADQFYLSHSSGRKIPAGDAIAQYWTVQPNGGLPEGTYTALVILTLDGGEEVELELSFTVAEPTEDETAEDAAETEEPFETEDAVIVEEAAEE